jgi:hypothetical protein
MTASAAFVILVLVMAITSASEVPPVGGIASGSWRISLASTDALPCPWGAEACLGGLTYGNTSCAAGYVGPLCALCDEDSFLEPTARVCEKCTSANIASSLALLCIFTLVFPLIVYRYISELVSYLQTAPEDEGSTKDAVEDVETGSLISIPPDAIENSIGMLMKHISRAKIFISTYQVR